MHFDKQPAYQAGRAQTQTTPCTLTSSQPIRQDAHKHRPHHPLKPYLHLFIIQPAATADQAANQPTDRPTIRLTDPPANRPTERPASKLTIPQGFMDAGKLVPDGVVVDMVKSRLGQPDVQRSGWLLDGYPRSAAQAEAIEKEGIRPDVFLLINVRMRAPGEVQWRESVCDGAVVVVRWRWKTRSMSVERIPWQSKRGGGTAAKWGRQVRQNCGQQVGGDGRVIGLGTAARLAHWVVRARSFYTMNICTDAENRHCCSRAWGKWISLPLCRLHLLPAPPLPQ
eukprot:364999-Chlamydomonas_euryale.AAC.30